MQEANDNNPRDAIIKLIDDKGSISVAEYMEIALSAYYSSKDPFGKAGDFITAPEISQMFGEIIASWLVDLWYKMGRPDKVNLIELGGGRGTLTADIMRVMNVFPDLQKALQVHMVDISPVLKKLQQNHLAKYDNVTWYNKLDEVPEGFSFIIANEFFDALPINQFERVDGKWRERVVTYDAYNDELQLKHKGCDLDIDAPAGSIYEDSPASDEVITQISKRIDEHGGAALIVDYGYDDVNAFGDTLQSMEKHAYADILEKTGDVDLTAHVNFAKLKDIADKNNVQTSRIMTQGEFLKTLGIEQRAKVLCENSKTKEEHNDIILSRDRLISKEEMGELFKVLALLNKNAIVDVIGFE